ncbi:hypothetical protein NDU88_003846 [Pleurodeles waltl]|uniref:Uncharacterized protein n=1 Tax=Pleurodeles waltl TaxID=8319 RepID=A0AAV7TQW7_PLEWA|nr:hypothetical protein NDU88_003846 [Pleurodeles waltl]
MLVASVVLRLLQCRNCSLNMRKPQSFGFDNRKRTRSNQATLSSGPDEIQGYSTDERRVDDGRMNSLVDYFGRIKM